MLVLKGRWHWLHSACRVGLVFVCDDGTCGRVGRRAHEAQDLSLSLSLSLSRARALSHSLSRHMKQRTSLSLSLSLARARARALGR